MACTDGPPIRAPRPSPPTAALPFAVLTQVKELMSKPAIKPEDRFDVEEARATLADAMGHVAEAKAALL